MRIDLLKLWRCAVLCWIVVPNAGGAWAEADGEGCRDIGGRPVQEVDDPLLPVAARAGREAGEPVLRINAAVMPELSPRARLFFHAYECSRHALGLPLGTMPTAGQARRADCWALGVLRNSGELADPGADQALQSELVFTREQWKLLPGPQREIDFSGCHDRGILRLPSAAQASPAQQGSNRCVHGCGDRLWQCQQSCRQAGCLQQCESVFDTCQARCPAP